MGKKDKNKVIIPKEEKEENILNEKPQEVKIKSKMYNNDFETELEKRDDMKEETNEAIMWGFVIGFALFFILLIVIIVCTK